MTRPFLLFALLICSVPMDLQAQQIVRDGDGTVSVRAVDVPVGVLLRELEAFGQFAKFRVDPSADDQRVTIALERVPVHVAVVEVLKQTEVGFVFAGGVDGEPFRLIAEMFEFVEGPRTRAAEHAPAQREAGPDSIDGEQDDITTLEAREAITNTDRTVAAMSEALSAPVVPAQSTGVVTLPFPNGAGEPITQTVAPGARSRVVPFPVSSTPTNRPPAEPTPTPEPSLRALEQALTPKPETKP